jgi:restriction endonuclease Mrr
MVMLTVTDALAEMTLLGKRIESARSTLEKDALVAIVQVHKIPTGYQSRDEFTTRARSLLQRVNALLNRRREIKRAVVLSNASTIVTIAEQEMTVAEAIEMKNFINAYESVLTTLQTAYTKAKREYEVAQKTVKDRLDKLALEVLGKTESINSEQYQSLSDSFLSREGVELLDPVNLNREIERRQEFIENFTSSVDRVLSISNARTLIDVPD